MKILTVFYPLFSLATIYASEPISVRFEYFLAHPVGVLDSAYTPKASFGLGLYLQRNLDNGHGLRWDILSATDFPNRFNVPDGIPVNTKLHSLGTSLSYLYHLNGTHAGPYVMAGLGLRKFNTQTSFPKGRPPQPIGGPGLRAYTQYAADTGLKPAFQVGAGYDFRNHWGATVRYQAFQSMGHTLATLEGGFNVRF